MSPPSTTHSFDEWFERSYAGAPEKREAALAVWNAVIEAAMNGAVQMRDAFVREGEYENGAIARDIAEMIGANAVPPRQLGRGAAAKFPPAPPFGGAPPAR